MGKAGRIYLGSGGIDPAVLAQQVLVAVRTLRKTDAFRLALAPRSITRRGEINDFRGYPLPLRAAKSEMRLAGSRSQWANRIEKTGIGHKGRRDYNLAPTALS
ncbi:hypothetical protein [Phaeobacter sp. J2-8]|uniref:hypothetical protein n=1 Tax=Phaeobacter sp. J2-8 TaxID=2931394 RepID=UPI001FD4B1EF|nr:hypothetical protein [Phaeobacter sp. J2-8]MCJ7873867.1 hypothetical protein [Phaeobacter sp. J2-8]